MIGYYVHHQGSGHVRRAAAVARRMQHDVVGLGSAPRPDGWAGAWVSLPRDDDPPVVDPEAADVTAGGVLHWVPRHHPGLRARHRVVADWIEEERPALVVVDVSVEISLLVRLCGVPVVGGAMPGDRTDRPHRLAYDLAEALLAPWPAQAHPDNGWPQAWTDKTWHVGGISALDPGTEVPGSGDDPAGMPSRTGVRDVLVLWGTGGDDPDQGEYAQAQRATPGWRWTFRGGRLPAADGAVLAAELRAADVVVCHAGQGSVADVALLRRPAVVLAQPRPHGEQEATVRAVGRMGLAATAVGWPSAEEWPALLEQALTTGGDGWERWGGEGAVAAAAHLDDLADRFSVETPAAPQGSTEGPA
ncbi:glycosyltransferase [Ornithinimicrobium sp. W1665]|uniref:glycosyltransferase n=1 Tax=Ornithinimicrobium sp. W1665 TaxID=3416666 RepID=UPI003CF1D3DB